MDKQWEKIKEKLKENMNMSDYAFISNETLSRFGGFDGEGMKIIVPNDFVKSMLEKPGTIDIIQNVATWFYGDNAYVSITVGDVHKQLYPKGWNEKENKKPRMCEILGVEVGERFRFTPPQGSLEMYYVDGNGIIRLHYTGGTACKDTIFCMINHPDKIIKNKLTEKEQKICEAIGAKYVTMDMKTHYGRVDLWKKEPKCDADGNYKHTTNGIFNEPVLACVLHEVFNSVKAGDCIYVGE